MPCPLANSPRSSGRLDVLVVPEKVGRVIFGLDFRQPWVVGAVGRPDQVAVAVGLPPDVVDVDPAGGVGLKGRPKGRGPI
jgi:hypothetical protein